MRTSHIIGLSFIAILLLSVILFFYLNRKTFETLVNDTLKIDGKWSKTCLTMFTAWIAALFAFMVNTIKHDGDVDTTMFGIMVGVALGAKIANSWGKKIEQPNTDSSKDCPQTNINIDANKA